MYRKNVQHSVQTDQVAGAEEGFPPPRDPAADQFLARVYKGIRTAPAIPRELCEEHRFIPCATISRRPAYFAPDNSRLTDYVWTFRTLLMAKCGPLDSRAFADCSHQYARTISGHAAG